MHILVITAHPSYAALFLGGTIIKHVQSGDQVAIVSLSAGEVGTASTHPDKTPEELVQIKVRDLEASARALGVQEVRVLRFRDTEFADTPELRLVIVDLIRELKPDIVLTHCPQSIHPDTRVVAQAVVASCFFAYFSGVPTAHPPHKIRKLYAFHEPASEEAFEPDFCVDISDVMDKKIEAAARSEAFVAEVSQNSSGHWTEIFLGPNMHWGKESGVRYAEAFKELKVHGLGKRALGALPV